MPVKHVNFHSLFIFLILGELLLTVAFSSPLLYSSSQGYFNSKAESASMGVPIFQKGMSYVSFPPSFDSADSDESLRLLSLTNTEWVAICVFWYQKNVSSTSIYPTIARSPTNSSIIHAINRAHELGMKVMLKPMVDPLDGNWRGMIPPSSAWFASYRNFINFWAEFAQDHGVEMLCVGCEFNGNDGSTSEWENIVAGVRERYSGPITYAANHDHEQSVLWWDSVDYVGIDAYYVLTNKDNPTLEELKQAWNSRANTIEAWQATVDKPVIFTELGYRSADGTNRAPWDYSGDPPLDLQEQMDCYEAAFQTLWNRSWFYGFYWWNWETRPDAGGSSDTGYTPQNKPVENTIRIWYSLEPRKPAFASLSKESYSSREEVLLRLVVSPNYSTLLVVQYNVSRDDSLVKSENVEVPVPSNGSYNMSIGRYKAGNYTLKITIINPSTGQSIYTTSMEFAVEPTFPIIPLTISVIAVITIILVLAMTKFKRKFRGLASAAARGMAGLRER